MSDQNKFHCNHKGMHFSDPGFKEICKEQCAACADFAPQDGGYSKEHQNKLTPDERSIICSSCHGSGGGMLNNGDGYMECINCDGEPIAKATWSHLQYAAQQTAAKDEEVKNLTEEVKSWKEKALDNEWHRIQKLEERIKELEKMYLDTRKACEKIEEMKDARIAELKKEYSELATLADRWLNGQAEAQLKCDQLLEKVEQLEKDLEAQKTKVKKHHDFCDQQDAKRVKQLEDVIAERDKAFDLLEEHTYTANTNERQAWLHKKNTLILSRVNKKPEQVDIVCPLCNGKGFTWALNRIGDDDSKECPRCKGIGKTTENKKPPYPENYDDAQFEAFNEQLP